MKRNHKTTAIQEVKDRNFISSSQIDVLNDLDTCKSLTTIVPDNYKALQDTIKGTSEVSFRGNTVQNLIDGNVDDRKYFFACDKGTNPESVILDHRGGNSSALIKFGTVASDLRWCYFMIAQRQIGYLLQPSKIYTLSFKFTSTKSFSSWIGIKHGDDTNDIVTNVRVDIKKGTFIYRAKVATLSSFDSKDVYNVGVYMYIDRLATFVSDLGMEFSNCMIIPDDVTSLPVPKFFEGIRSSFETPSTLISYGENMVDVSKFKSLENDDRITISHTDHMKGSLHFYKSVEQGAFLTQDINVTPNTDYIIEYDSSINNSSTEYVNLYIYGDHEQYYGNPIIQGFKTLKFNSGTHKIIRFGIYGSSTQVGTFRMWNVRMYANTTSSKPFIPHTRNVANINIPPLRKLYSSVQDTMEGNVITRRVGKVILDGSRNWDVLVQNPAQPENIKTIAFSLDFPECKPGMNHRLCSRFLWLGSNCMYDSSTKYSDYEQIGSWSNVTAPSINIRIAKARLSSPTIEGFKSWLASVKVVLYYELPEPIIEIVEDSSVFINSYDKETTYILEEPINTEMKIVSPIDFRSKIKNLSKDANVQSRRLQKLKDVQFSLIAELLNN